MHLLPHSLLLAQMLISVNNFLITILSRLRKQLYFVKLLLLEHGVMDIDRLHLHEHVLPPELPDRRSPPHHRVDSVAATIVSVLWLWLSLPVRQECLSFRGRLRHHVLRGIVRHFPLLKSDHSRKRAVRYLMLALLHELRDFIQVLDLQVAIGFPLLAVGLALLQRADRRIN